MKDGWVQQVGEPMEIYAKPQNKFVAGFIGSPSMNFIPVTLTDGSGALFAETGGIKIKVPPASTQGLLPYKGQSLTLGVRPEDLRVGESSDSADLSFETVVEVVEPLGSEILLDTRAAGQQIVARVEPTVRTRPHEKIRLTFIPDRIHFFDAATHQVASCRHDEFTERLRGALLASPPGARGGAHRRRDQPAHGRSRLPGTAVHQGIVLATRAEHARRHRRAKPDPPSLMTSGALSAIGAVESWWDAPGGV
jgi:hypothetical protein